MYIAVYSVRLLIIERKIVKDWYLFSIQVASDKKMPLYHPPTKISRPSRRGISDAPNLRNISPYFMQSLIFTQMCVLVMNEADMIYRKRQTKSQSTEKSYRLYAVVSKTGKVNWILKICYFLICANFPLLVIMNNYYCVLIKGSMYGRFKIAKTTVVVELIF